MGRSDVPIGVGIDVAGVGGEESQGAQVDLVVAAQGRRQRWAVLREGRRIDDDGVELLAGTLALAQVLEGVGFDEGDVRAVKNRQR